MKKIVALISVYSLPIVLVAQEVENKLRNPLETNNFGELFNNILGDIIIPVSAVIATFMIIWAGLSFVLAQGNDGKLTIAKQRLLYVLIGSVIILGAEIILNLLLNTLSEVTNIN